MKHLAGLQRLLVAAAAVTALTAASALPAEAATANAGLYGAADPTYDGVYRQGMALGGLAVHGIRPAPSAVRWLLGQQCANGSFQAYRADVRQPCGSPDPVNFSGPDTNSTASALGALMTLDTTGTVSGSLLDDVVAAADRAGRWLAAQQNADGGWPYYSGGASDANSTGVAMATLGLQGPWVRSDAYREGRRYLGSVAFSCPSGGGFAYQSGQAVNPLATAQGLTGIVGAVPLRGPLPVAVGAPCANTAEAKAVSYIARELAKDGSLDSAFTGGPDLTATGWGVVGLAMAGKGRSAVTRGTAALKAQARAETQGTSGAIPGDLGLFLLVAKATGSKPTDFGGVNLVSTLTSSITR